jgi:hypothetical protein
MAVDENCMTPKEPIECQLKSTTLEKIRQSLKHETYDQDSSIEFAKDLWEKLSVMFDGTSAMQKTKYEAAKQDMNLFCMHDGESVTSAYSRLQALKEKIILLGGNTIIDGFHMNDNFMKNKFTEIVSTKYKELAFNVTFLEPCRKMNVDELVGYFVSHDDMIVKANRTKEIVHAMNKNLSLALKAKVTKPKVHEASKEERFEEDPKEEEEMTSTSELDTDLAFFSKKYGKHSMKKGSFASKENRRSCYNCDEPRHLSDTCPYEKRQDKPKYAKGVRPKLKPNPVNLRNKNKFKDIKALLGVEYTSDVDEEESEEEDIVGVASLALAKLGSLFKYDYTKDYKKSTKNSPHKCLMAKEAKVTLTRQPSCSINDDMDEEDILATLYKTMCSLRGDAHAHFEYLIDTIAQCNESLGEARFHLEDGE